MGVRPSQNPQSFVCSIRTCIGDVGPLPVTNLAARFTEDPFVVEQPDFAGSLRVERLPHWFILVENLQVLRLLCRRRAIRAEQEAIGESLHNPP